MSGDYFEDVNKKISSVDDAVTDIDMFMRIEIERLGPMKVGDEVHNMSVMRGLKTVAVKNAGRKNATMAFTDLVMQDEVADRLMELIESAREIQDVCVEYPDTDDEVSNLEDERDKMESERDDLQQKLDQITDIIDGDI